MHILLYYIIICENINKYFFNLEYHRVSEREPKVMNNKSEGDEYIIYITLLQTTSIHKLLIFILFLSLIMYNGFIITNYLRHIINMN